MKLCVNCKHISVDGVMDEDLNYAKCKRTKIETTNPVTGVLRVHMQNCGWQREGSIAGYCGEDAQYWEAKK